MTEGEEYFEEHDTASMPSAPTCAQPACLLEDMLIGKPPPSPCSSRSVAQQETEPEGGVRDDREPRKNRRVSVGSVISVTSLPPFQFILKKLNQKLDEIEDDEQDDKEVKENKFNDNPFGRLCQSKRFEMVSIAIVCLNAVWMGYTTDIEARFIQAPNMYVGDPLVPVVENLFSIFFVFEIAAKTIGAAEVMKLLLDVSYLFDFALVALMVSDTWVVPFVGASPLGNLQLLRLLRLLRITRMAKLMKAFPELLILIRGIRSAIRAVVWDLILLLLVTYTWAILMTNEYHAGAVQEPIDEFFGSMSNSLFTLLIMGTILDDITRCTNAIRATNNYWMLGLFILYVAMNSFTLLNMLIGVLAGVVENTTREEKNNIEEDAVKDRIRRACKRLDETKKGAIFRADYYEYGRKNGTKGFEDLQLEYSDFLELGEIIFAKHDNRLEIDELACELLRLQPKHYIGVLDMKGFVGDVNKMLKTKMEVVVQLDKDCKRIMESTTSSDPSGADQNQNLRDQDLDEEQVIRALGQVSFLDILSELQRRLKVSTLKKASVPSSWLVMDERETAFSGRSNI